MTDVAKTRDQLIKQLDDLRKRVAELEIASSELNWAKDIINAQAIIDTPDLESKEKNFQAGVICKESEEKFAKAFLQNSVPMAISTIKEGRFVDVSDAFLDLMGLSRDAIIGNTSTGVGFITPEQRSVVLSEFSKNGRVVNLELQVRIKGGEFRYGLFNSTKIQIGQEEYLLTVATDITQQKQAEESLKMSEDRFRRMTNNLPGAVYQFYARPNGEMGLYFLSERAFELLGLENELQNFFPLVTSCIVPEDREAFLESIQEAVRTLSRWDHEVRYISPGGKEMYIRGLSQPRQQKDEIVFDGVLLDVTDRKKAEERLLSSEKKFSTAFHANPAPMVITDPADGRIVDFNSACEAWSGYTRDEGIGQTTIGLGILSAEQREKLNEAITRQGKADFISMDYKVKDGEVRKTLHSARFISIDNKTHLLSHILDITEQSKAEKALIDRQARLNSIFRAAPTGIGVAVNRILAEVNDRICEMTGYTREELLGKSASLFYATKEEFDQVGLKKNRQMEQLGMGSVETRWRRKDGQIIDIILTSAAIVPGDPTAGVTFTALDITRRKRAEDALRESESKYRFLTERINDIVWVADMDFNLTYMSPSVERIMGYTPQERLGKKASSTMTPESAAKSFEMFVAEIQRVRKGSGETTKPILMELEYCHKNGSTVWMEVNASLLLDAAGQIFGAHGVSRDINMRKRAENALRESEAKYRFLTEKMYDIIWTAGLDFQLTYDSPSVERVLGYTPQERMRQKASEMLTPESYAYALEVLSAELMHDQEEGVDPDRTIKLELEYYHKNGSTVWMECIVSAIRDHDGGISGIHGVSRDITHRRQVEEELKKHRYQLEELVNERTAELTKAYEYLKQENEARKAGESALRARELELEKGRRELVEMNSALKVLLKQREEDKVNMEMNIISNIKTSVLPYIEKLESSGLAEGQMRVSSMIKSLLGEITSPFIKKVSSEFLGFTPNEIQVASLVKEGKSSKEIAEILNISLNTVHTYRYKIRIKTGLKNNKVNLRSYLQTLG